ncbi:MAG: hypothetical protein A2289_06455 [Deltaproteobacteria bacterium RIFOXYA12_FULL_58_15]|nr:MAG: hypothetical protein A2289_06455 [Deltaproteobacteria bacterium RIFOXYA12_FULL_58_15]
METQMKSILGWLVVLGLVVGGAGFGLWQFNQTTQEQAYHLELAQLKRGFLNSFVGLRIQSTDEYRKEVGIALTKYFGELDKLAKKYPDFYDIERELKHGEAELAAGRMPESQKLGREERIAITLDLFKRMRQGQYRPLYTGSDKTFRFDVWDITPAKVSGEMRVKMSYAHWGAFGPVSYQSIIGNMPIEQEKGKPAEVKQFVGDGQPPSLQIDPERWVAEFPPGVEIGHYDLPQFPREATSVELTFVFDIRTIGGSSQTATILFDDVPIPESWKVPEGQKWEGQERLASDDELRAAGATVQDVPGTTRIDADGAEINVTR